MLATQVGGQADIEDKFLSVQSLPLGTVLSEQNDEVGFGSIWRERSRSLSLKFCSLAWQRFGE
ncbi:MAG: hypothetical protein AB4050_01195 [Synechococcus sp.]